MARKKHSPTWEVAMPMFLVAISPRDVWLEVKGVVSQVEGDILPLELSDSLIAFWNDAWNLTNNLKKNTKNFSFFDKNCL